MKKFRYNKEYNIINKEVNDHSMIFYTDKVRNKEIFVNFKIINNKIKLFTKVQIEQRLVLKSTRMYNTKHDDRHYSIPKEIWIFDKYL